MVEMELVAVRVELPGNTPVVLLREKGDASRLLPIFIGPPEAQAIDLAMRGDQTPRPMTHDLLCTVVSSLGGTLEQVVVTHLEDGIFYAELHIRVGDRVEVISARPSDSMAVALRVGCPILVDESVLEVAGIQEEQEEAESEQVVELFREFIDSVNPEDFAS
jgi:bifunctional DNase/RNase